MLRQVKEGGAGGEELVAPLFKAEAKAPEAILVGGGILKGLDVYGSDPETGCGKSSGRGVTGISGMRQGIGGK